MKHVLFLIALSAVGLKVNPQDASGDTYTIQRLIVSNDEGKILLEKHANGWMTPALRHSSKVGTNEGLRGLAAEFGLVVSTPRLAGVFAFLPEYKPESSFRQHYVTGVVGGELKLPDGKLDAQWFAPHEAVEAMSLPGTKLIFAVRDMTEQLLNYPEVVWGGTFSLWKVDGVTKYRVSENFYSLVDVK